MTEVTINKHLTNDFNSGVNTTQLMKEINDSSIGPECIVVLNLGLNVSIKFATSLSAEETTTLNNIVSSHTPTSVEVSEKIYTITPKQKKIYWDNYALISRFDYAGSSSDKIKCIRVISYIDDDITSASLKIINMGDMTTIAEKTDITNTEPIAVNIGTISNLPSGPAIFEIYAKKIGGVYEETGVYVDQITIHIE